MRFKNSQLTGPWIIFNEQIKTTGLSASLPLLLKENAEDVRIGKIYADMANTHFSNFISQEEKEYFTSPIPFKCF